MSLATRDIKTWMAAMKFRLCVFAATLLLLTSSADAKLVLLNTMDDADIDGTTLLDKTTPAENGTLLTDVFGGATGRIGQAIDANTIGSAAAVDYGDVLDPGPNDMTAMLWFNADSVLSQTLARKGNGASQDEGWSISLESRNSGAFLRVYGRVNATGQGTNDDRALLLKDFTSETSTNAWRHVAMVIHGAGSIEFFVDGSNDDVVSNVWGSTFNTEPNGISNTSKLLLGLGIGGNGTDVKFDEFAIYDSALSAGDIAQIYADGLNGIGISVPDASVPGDYNGNGVADAADYTMWRNSLGQTGAGLAADGSGLTPGVPDGVVDQFDYDLWKANFGAGTQGGAGTGGFQPIAASVPEPTSLVLLALGLAFALWHGKRTTFAEIR
jgi:hypothetical protein